MTLRGLAFAHTAHVVCLDVSGFRLSMSMPLSHFVTTKLVLSSGDTDTWPPGLTGFCVRWFYMQDGFSKANSLLVQWQGDPNAITEDTT